MKKTIIIAEAGVNHNGDLELAKQMVRIAKESGADIVKFQTANLDKLITRHAEMADYQKENLGFEKTQREMLEEITLPYDAFYEIADYCKNVGIDFLSTPFDIESVHFLQKLGCKMWKIPSGEITNFPYLVEIAKTKQPIIMSTGMSDMDDIRNALMVLKKNGAVDISLLHCNTQYPTPMEDVNLNAMLTLKKEFNCEVGYSDHTLGVEVSIAAVALGATIIEKHFTLDRTMKGPDHRASVEPNELSQMIRSIRNIEKALGSYEKKITPSEMQNVQVARKSIVAATKIKKGDVFTEDNITVKRPGTGVNPMRWDEMIGQVATRDYEEDEMIDL